MSFGFALSSKGDFKLLVYLILLLSGIYFLNHGLYSLYTGKPAIKADGIRKLIIVFTVILLVDLLFALFIAFVGLYGFSYGNFTFGEQPFYLLIFLLCLLVLWGANQFENDVHAFNKSMTILAVVPDFALAAVRETLDEMSIGYEETIAGFNVVDKNIFVHIKLNRNRVSFIVTRPVDKIFLKHFCRSYQAMYRQKCYPLNRQFLFISMLVGVLIFGLFFLMMFDFTSSLAEFISRV